jgi:hypothetical protein
VQVCCDACWDFVRRSLLVWGEYRVPIKDPPTNAFSLGSRSNRKYIWGFVYNTDVILANPADILSKSQNSCTPHVPLLGLLLLFWSTLSQILSAICTSSGLTMLYNTCHVRLMSSMSVCVTLLATPGPLDANQSRSQKSHLSTFSAERRRYHEGRTY